MGETRTEKYFFKNGKLPKILGEKHQLIDSKSSANTKKYKCKENHKWMLNFFKR